MNPDVASEKPVIDHPAASKDVAGIVDFADILARKAGAKYVYCTGKFVLGAPDDTEVLGCRALTGEETFSGLIDRYALRYGDGDRRAVVSMWTMYYFSTLMIGAAVSWLELRRILPLCLDRLNLAVDASSGEPRAFVFSDWGREDEGASVHDAFHEVIREHAELLIDAIAAQSGVSRKLLWANAAGYLSWIVGEVGRLTDPALAVEGRALLDDPFWPDGWKNPMHGMIRRECGQGGETIDRRRVCCLRYALPGIAGCGMVCPLPQGRN